MNREGRNNRADGSADRVGQDLYSGPSKRRTTGQRTGVEDNPSAPDAMNGYLNQADVNEAHVTPLAFTHDLGKFVAVGSGWAAKQRAILREMDRARQQR